MRSDSGLHPLSGMTFLLVALNLALPAAIGTLAAGALPKIDSDYAAMLGAAALAAVLGLLLLAGEALARARSRHYR